MSLYTKLAANALFPLHERMKKHSTIDVFRAMENGASVVRQTDEGLSIVVDGYGRTLASGEGLADSGNYLLVEVPTSSPTTIYPVIGDVIGVMATVGFVVLAIYALLMGRRTQLREVPEIAVATA